MHILNMRLCLLYRRKRQYCTVTVKSGTNAELFFVCATEKSGIELSLCLRRLPSGLNKEHRSKERKNAVCYDLLYKRRKMRMQQPVCFPELRKTAVGKDCSGHSIIRIKVIKIRIGITAARKQLFQLLTAECPCRRGLLFTAGKRYRRTNSRSGSLPAGHTKAVFCGKRLCS